MASTFDAYSENYTIFYASTALAYYVIFDANSETYTFFDAPTTSGTARSLTRRDIRRVRALRREL